MMKTKIYSFFFQNYKVILNNSNLITEVKRVQQTMWSKQIEQGSNLQQLSTLFIDFVSSGLQ